MDTNYRFIRALKREPVDKTPIWIMRQAGRYLPEYLKTRDKAGDFMTLCKTPELACEVTLQPITRYELDAAILFSDILTIPDAMGMGVSIIEQRGPVFAKTIQSAADVEELPSIDPGSELKYVMDAVQLIKSSLAGRLPLIGFSGSPFTLATYMVEGQATHAFYAIKKMLYSAPEVLHRLLTKLTVSIQSYLHAQISHGVDAVMVFDTWGGVLSTRDYQQFSLVYMQNIVHYLKHHAPDIPIILFTKGGGGWLETIAETGCQCVGLDWTTDINDAKRRVGKQVSLQGNLDPVTLLAPPSVIIEKTKQLLDDYGEGSGHVFNLGHGILPHIPPEHVTALVETVNDYSRKFHNNRM
ncbi:uroporphyrinogen decarboxylase [Legionella taurinensis]|uniref:Uroporphyrinogen decarboxylase n=1 Tax=Legionella taurinensis TaxID=70611 RepID=A0A3A5L8E2_9GAMM|nr:uroporphyrinogen decarboxylase [Legionella taurinensis]MDX1838719.1 uroporphyrinogen decarboxylase [Legionella taurinensis]PUT38781.1 uroporphyrinogen decarboxylase [Legionella taurinensis]PUT40221.1 uroporphyrinogen decarboxylase [Legionella taurinensis]PUT42528.1 uroporphyrinogen decarboxylase [Legionella taurinensis]PUT45947.1 uroporphyrinogen decarboxylase [Legionella taurinensis]